MKINVLMDGIVNKITQYDIRKEIKLFVDPLVCERIRNKKQTQSATGRFLENVFYAV